MKEFKYTITDPEGIHARPAGELAKKAATYTCNVRIARGEKEVDAKRIMGIMTLGVKQGMEIIIRTEGEGEDEAIVELQQFVEASF